MFIQKLENPKFNFKSQLGAKISLAEVGKLLTFFNLLADGITNAYKSCTGGTLCNQWSLF